MRKLFIAITLLGFIATAKANIITTYTANTSANSIIQDEEAPAELRSAHGLCCGGL